MYQVQWLHSALNELAEIWNEADSNLRKTVTQATYALEKILSQQADAVGESRPGDRRILFEAPMGIIYRIESGNVVTISRVWVFTRKN